ncbi:MAG: LysE family transporter [Acidobacteriota bacterium]
MKPFVEGLLAGYGISIPLGGIAVLIVDVGLRKGFRRGFFAGAGAATADFLGAFAVAVAGGILGEALAPLSGTLRVASGVGLVAMGAWGFWRNRVPRSAAARPPRDLGDLGTYVQFVGLTLVNPLTVAYFAAFVLGRGAKELSTWPARSAFVAGFALASLSWQTLLALFGAVTHHFVSPRIQKLLSLVGNLLVVGLGVRMIVWSPRVAGPAAVLVPFALLRFRS